MSKEKQTKKLYCEIEKYNLKFHQKIYRAFKALCDFMIGFIGLVICILPFIIIAVAIKCDSKGPVFFRQKRIGKKGKEFYCYKFRSMSTDARHDVAGYQYSEVNNYITKVGKFLRKTSLDELPQLFNLMNGTMSLIGYRPSQKSEEELNTAREGFNLYQIRPGISGWAQINGRDILAAHPKLKAKYDGYYLVHFSIFMDVKIFFLSIFKVLKRSDIEEGTIENRFNEEDQ